MGGHHHASDRFFGNSQKRNAGGRLDSGGRYSTRLYRLAIDQHLAAAGHDHRRRPPTADPRSRPPPSVHRSSAYVKTVNEVSCRSTSDGATCLIHGTAQGTSGTQYSCGSSLYHRLLRLSGYYIQRNGTGVTRQPRPGAASTWEGQIHIGNAQYPPCQGDTFNVIATLDEKSTAANLIGQSQLDVFGPNATKPCLRGSR